MTRSTGGRAGLGTRETLWVCVSPTASTQNSRYVCSSQTFSLNPEGHQTRPLQELASGGWAVPGNQ